MSKWVTADELYAEGVNFLVGIGKNFIVVGPNGETRTIDVRRQYHVSTGKLQFWLADVMAYMEQDAAKRLGAEP